MAVYGSLFAKWNPLEAERLAMAGTQGIAQGIQQAGAGIGQGLQQRGQNIRQEELVQGEAAGYLDKEGKNAPKPKANRSIWDSLVGNEYEGDKGSAFGTGYQTGRAKATDEENKFNKQLSLANIQIGAQQAQANQAKVDESAKNEREAIEGYTKTARDLRLTDDVIDTDPAFEKFRGRTRGDWENIVAIGQQRETARKERQAAIIAKIGADKTGFTNSNTLRQGHEAEAKPFYDAVSNATLVENLVNVNNASSNAIALKTLNRMAEPGAVTASDMQALSAPGGLLDQARAMLAQAKDGKFTPEMQAQLLETVKQIKANKQRSLTDVNADYSDIATQSGFRPELVVQGRYRNAGAEYKRLPNGEVWRQRDDGKWEKVQ